MPKFAIYTALVGKYDKVCLPQVINTCFDYYLFTDNIDNIQFAIEANTKRHNPWQIKYISYKNTDPVKVARYVKTHSHTLLPNYDATLWIDANIQITDEWIYNRIIEEHALGNNIAAVRHPERDCIYEEIMVVFRLGYEEKRIIDFWFKELLSYNYPRENGLHETGILYRASTKDVQRLNEDWWAAIEKYSRRDQLSFDFAIWKQQIDIHPLTPPGENVYNSKHFTYTGHNTSSIKVKQRGNNATQQQLNTYYQTLSFTKKKKFNKLWWRIYSLPHSLSSLCFASWKQYLQSKQQVYHLLYKFSKHLHRKILLQII